MTRIGVILFSVICLFSSCIKEKVAGADLKAGDRLPEFSVKMSDGTTMTDDILSDGVSCIVFFYTSCPDCQKALPSVQRIYDEYTIYGVTFALISREEKVETILPYWQSNGFTMPFSAQEDRKIYELFAKTRVPRIYIVKDGIIEYIFTDNPVPEYETLYESLRVLLEK